MPPAAAPPATAAKARAATPSSGAQALGESALAAKAVPRNMPPSLAQWLRAAGLAQSDPAWPLTPAQRQLLLQLEAATPGAWQAAAAPVATAGGDAREMAWRNQAGQLSSLRVDSQGAHWAEPNGQTWFAPLDSAARAALLRGF